MQSADMHATYPRDMLFRYPELRSQALPRYPVVLEHSCGTETIDISGDAAFTLIVARDGETCRITCDSNQVDEQYALSLKNQFSAFVNAALNAPDEQLSRLPLVSAGEKNTIIERWNDTRRECSTDICMHELFEQQVLRQPDAVATIYEGTAVTYAGLNAHANRIARHLRAQGVTPGMLVGVCLDRRAAGHSQGGLRICAA
jgi:non-ribosomal peptide synthetase component F